MPARIWRLAGVAVLVLLALVLVRSADVAEHLRRAQGWMEGLGPHYWVGWLAVEVLFVYEHSLVTPRDLSKVNVAFFNVNGYIALVVLVAVVLGLR